jgi:hypothetical protein
MVIAIAFQVLQSSGDSLAGSDNSPSHFPTIHFQRSAEVRFHPHGVDVRRHYVLSKAEVNSPICPILLTLWETSSKFGWIFNPTPPSGETFDEMKLPNMPRHFIFLSSLRVYDQVKSRPSHRWRVPVAQKGGASKRVPPVCRNGIGALS